MDSDAFRRRAIEMTLARQQQHYSDPSPRRRAMVHQEDGDSYQLQQQTGQQQQVRARVPLQQWLTSSSTSTPNQQRNSVRQEGHSVSSHHQWNHSSNNNNYGSMLIEPQRQRAKVNPTSQSQHQPLPTRPLPQDSSSYVSTRQQQQHQQYPQRPLSNVPPSVAPESSYLFDQLHRQLSDLRREYLSPPRRQAPVLTPQQCLSPVVDSMETESSRSQRPEPHSRSITHSALTQAVDRTPNPSYDTNRARSVPSSASTSVQPIPREETTNSTTRLVDGPMRGSEERVTTALSSRLAELESRLNALQTDYVRRQAAHGLDLDRCRRALGNTEFRLHEVQSVMSEKLGALATRMESASRTAREGLEEYIRRVNIQLKETATKCLREATAASRERQTAQLTLVQSLRHSMMEQERQHDATLREIALRLANTIRQTQQRVQAVQHVAGHLRQPRTSSHLYHTTLTQLTSEVRKQLAQMRRDRETYEEHFVERVAKMTALVSQRTV